MKFKRYEGNPILSPNSANAWESLVTTNPGAWYDEEQKTVYLLYRAAGHDVEHRIHFGLALSKDGYHFTRTSDQPALSPSKDGFDAGCVEDPRIVKIGDWFYVTYAARPFPPGQYWLMPGNQPIKPSVYPDDFPWVIRKNHTWTGLGLTRDFRTWIRAGRITHPLADDRDAILFPAKVNSRYYLIHRPSNWIGPQYGTEQASMWISWSEDLLDWKEPKKLAKPAFEWESDKIGGNTPPIRTEHGWLTIYHAVGSDKHYRLGAMLLDLDDPSQVRYRSRDWLLQPEEWYEKEGFYPGVCFPCGKVVIGDTLFVYYGGADKYIGLATCRLQDLLDYLLTCPWIG